MMNEMGINMNTKYIKLLILVIPSFAIGFWEYFRHEYLLFVLTMQQGNWLAPLIVFVVTALFVSPLFRRMESIQAELHKVSKTKVQLEEREKMAQELHDGIAQSIFLLTVKLDKLERQIGDNPTTTEIRETVHQMNDYVRDSIATLTTPIDPNHAPFDEAILHLVDTFKLETGLTITLDWNLYEHDFTAKELAVLLTVIREGLFNIRKHSNATEVQITSKGSKNQWSIRIEDNGINHSTIQPASSNQFGLKLLNARCMELGWQLQLSRKSGWTQLSLLKEN